MTKVLFKGSGDDETPTSPPVDPGPQGLPLDGMNAKERRAAKRRAEQAAAARPVSGSSDGGGDLGTTSDAPVKTVTAMLQGHKGVESPQLGSFATQNVGMNAKERRAARREAERNSTIKTSKSELAPGDDRGSPTVVEAGGGTNAKARRAEKRAAARAAAETAASEINAGIGRDAAAATPSPKMATTTVGTTAKTMTAKERRAARRAAAREALVAAPSVTSNDGDNNNTDTNGRSSKGEMTSKERRLLRRQEERKKREREEQGERQGERGTGRGKRAPQASSGPAKRRKGSGSSSSSRKADEGGVRANPYIVFVGQLAFSTTAKAVEDHFRTRGGVEGKISVRLLTRKGTNPPRSKGMAFVEVEDPETAYCCLGLHHSRLDGRLINVEQTSGGGKEKKGERIKEKRGEQKELMKSVVQRVLGEFIKAGRLGENELDAAAKGVLEKMEAKVMERAVKDYCDKPDRLELHNPSAWFTHHAHELAFRADPEQLDAGARNWLRDERVKDTARHAADKGGGQGFEKAKARNAAGGRGGARGGGGDGRGKFGGGRGRGRVGAGTISGADSVKARPSGAIVGRAAGGRPPERLQQTADAQVDGPGGAPRGSGPGGEGVAVSPPKLDDLASEHRPDGGGGGPNLHGGRHRATSDLVSIFPSLRGRGGATAGRGRGGRGSAGRGS